MEGKLERQEKKEKGQEDKMRKSLQNILVQTDCSEELEV